ncbi:MAG: hypothetical protein IJM59_10985 [Proteobacteria bacterium]|nr:hypothetical protein [Pseudomonadota bacterium]
MKRKCLLIVLSALVGIAGFGCHEDSQKDKAQPPAGSDEQLPGKDECDPPCPELQECIESSCQPKDDLCGGKVCSDEQQCVMDECVLKNVAECVPDCTDNTVCVNGKCEPFVYEDPCETKQCSEDEECINGECHPLQKPNCGEEYCVGEQVCYREHCIQPSDLCGDVVCSDNQKCVNSECIDKTDCDDKKCEGQTRCVLNDEQEGVCLEEACIANDTPKICDAGQECRAGVCTDINCEGGTIDEQTGKCFVPVKSIELDQTELVLLRDSSVTISAKVLPANATHVKLEWKIANISEGTYKNDDIKGLATLTPGDSSAVVKSKSVGARMIEVTASTTDGTNLSAKATIELKPYTYYKDPIQYPKEELECGQYGTETTKVFNHDLYTEYVYPVMLKKGSEAYGTRASVVAAARFLTLQFPYFVKYYDTSHMSNCPTISHYVWTSGTKASNAQDVRIFGLNLTKNAYNDYRSNQVIKSDITPWSCYFPKDDTKCNVYSSKQNGLGCSGFVSWAFRNGRFYVGDWFTHIFGYKIHTLDGYYCANSSGNAIRNFYCKSIIHGGNSNYRIIANPNNASDYAYDKFSRIDDKKDYLYVKTLSQEQLKDVKAGDLLWHDGHVAMIIGMDRNTDGTLKWIYVGEASRKGNDVQKFSFEGFTQCSKWSTPRCDSSKGGCVNDSEKCIYYEDDKLKSYIIKMDRVYNYYSEYYNLSEDGNTYQYTDMWPQ